MPAVLLKMTEEQLEQSDEFAGALKISRTEYIRRAVDEMNRRVKAGIRAKRMAEASQKVRSESMAVNAEFTAIEKDPDV
ncbi:MAG: hypothetical protein WC889_08900 [Myxococcota bacterium]|jgi:hypothetical protein